MKSPSWYLCVSSLAIFAGSIGILPDVSAEEIASERAKFKTEVIAEGLENPWGLAKLPDGSLLVTERPGRVRLITPDGKLQSPLEGIPEVRAKGQGGMLDVALHPDYQTNGWVYLAYSTAKDDTGHTKIIRGRIKDNAFVDQEVIFEPPSNEYTAANHHFGCRIVFDQNGYLFFSIGDRGTAPNPENNAQKLDVVAGKIHRIHDDGRIPEDNPFYSQGGSARTIWSYGNRNAQGLTMHPKTGVLWETEHGPRGGDELNIIEKGKNYGWPIVSYGINYNGKSFTDKTEAPGMEPPVVQWTPSIGVAGIDFYFGDKFPEWNGNLFVTGLSHKKVIRVEINEQNEATHQEILLEKSGRLRDVRSFDDGFLYLVYDDPGKVVKLLPAG